MDFRELGAGQTTGSRGTLMGAGSVAEVVKLYLFATEAATPPVTGFPLPGHGERPIGNRQRTD